MWKTSQKFLPLSQVHAPGSSYLLAGYARYLNPANYFSHEQDLHNTYKLASVVIALRKENEKLQTYIDSARPGASERTFYQHFIDANKARLQTLLPKLRAEAVYDGSLPIDTLAGFAYVLAEEGLLTAGFFDTHLRDRVAAKLEFASVQGLGDLATALQAISYDRSSGLWRQLTERIGQKLQVRAA